MVIRAFKGIMNRWTYIYTPNGCNKVRMNVYLVLRVGTLWLLKEPDDERFGDSDADC